MKTETKTNRPDKKFSTGAISATVWKNRSVNKEGQPFTYPTISIERRYQKEGRWESTNSLRINDLPKAALVLQKAYEYLIFDEGQEAEG